MLLRQTKRVNYEKLSSEDEMEPPPHQPHTTSVNEERIAIEIMCDEIPDLINKHKFENVQPEDIKSLVAKLEIMRRSIRTKSYRIKSYGETISDELKSTIKSVLDQITKYIQNSRDPKYRFTSHNSTSLESSSQCKQINAANGIDANNQPEQPKELSEPDSTESREPETTFVSKVQSRDYTNIDTLPDDAKMKDLPHQDPQINISFNQRNMDPPSIQSSLIVAKSYANFTIAKFRNHEDNRPTCILPLQSHSHKPADFGMKLFLSSFTFSSSSSTFTKLACLSHSSNCAFTQFSKHQFGRTWRSRELTIVSRPHFVFSSFMNNNLKKRHVLAIQSVNFEPSLLKVANLYRKFGWYHLD